MKCCDLTPGSLDRQISIYTPTRTEDGSGGYTVVDTLVKTLWAKIVPVSGTERIIAANIAAVGMMRFYTRFTDSITEQMTIRYNDRSYNIRSIIDVEEQREWLEILAEKGVAL
jgi:SPP1 family predicted phage head-tail adaptor